MKIVINSQIGSFCVTRHIAEELAELCVKAAINDIEAMADEPCDHYPLFDVDRKDPRLIYVIEDYNSEVPHLKIVEIPDGVKFYIHANEMGVESVHEEHRIWT